MNDFDKLLRWLDPDPDKAASEYGQIRAKLARFFECRGCGVDADALADETIDRVMNKINDLAPTYEGPRIRYFFGVARNRFHEWVDEQIKKQSLRPPPTGDSDGEKELLDRCLRKCMAKHNEKEQRMILRYYTGDKQEKIVNRKKLAEDEGIELNALRIRAHRIRTALRICVEKCIEEDQNDETESWNDH